MIFSCKFPTAKAVLLITTLGLVTTAGAQTLLSSPARTTDGVTGHIVLIQQKKGQEAPAKKYKKRKPWQYDGKQHGKRYREKRPGFHFYNGWWYPRPFWLD